jgi:hypothetical protein
MQLYEVEGIMKLSVLGVHIHNFTTALCRSMAPQSTRQLTVDAHS